MLFTLPLAPSQLTQTSLVTDGPHNGTGERVVGEAYCERFVRFRHVRVLFGVEQLLQPYIFTRQHDLRQVEWSVLGAALPLPCLMERFKLSRLDAQEVVDAC